MKLKGDIGIILTSNITDSCCSEFEWEIRCLFVLINFKKKNLPPQRKENYYENKDGIPNMPLL